MNLHLPVRPMLTSQGLATCVFHGGGLGDRFRRQPSRDPVCGDRPGVVHVEHRRIRFGAICGAMLFHIGDDPVQVVQIVMTCSIANQAKMTWELRGDFDWRNLRWFLTGGIGGLPIGVWLLFHVETRLYIHALGLFLFLYGGYMLFRRPIVLPQNAGRDIVAGFLGGVTGGATGFPSASVSIWCSN
jgi:uncharacterized membrane protein YfcA